MKRVILITANVGSLFEDVSLRRPWLNRVVEKIRSANACFVALHMQETGGKHFQVHSHEVPKMVEDLYKMLQPDYSSCFALLDLDFNAVEEYTALGSVFFTHKSAFSTTSLFNFGKGKFERLKQSGLYIKQDLRKSTKLRKEEVPARVLAGRSVGTLDLINIHLFHDESNLAIYENPSLYSANRKCAMDFVLERYVKFCAKNGPGQSLLFVFGDFNFRLNASTFLKKITFETEQFDVENDPDGSPKHHSSDDSDPSLRSNSNSYNNVNDHYKRQLSAIEFRRAGEEDQACVLRIEKKRFDYYDQSLFMDGWRQFREDDQEANGFQLHEAAINFPPTYPWSEDPEDSNCLMNTRAPAWCDRILMNETAWSVVSNDLKHDYNCIGDDGCCMGDHKPVYLSFGLSHSS
ncbi:Inositol-polyphosphate 5-phosphatase [Aphelenchoides fujianensis]|nr:Inositol-polyphosphate 5-phosphatase [Aphelenchoides fujianensis]